MFARYIKILSIFCLRTLDTFRYTGIRAVSFSPDGKCILTGGTDGTAIVWDAQTKHILYSFTEIGSIVNALTFSPDGSQAAIMYSHAWGEPTNIKIFNTTTWKSMQTISQEEISSHFLSNKTILEGVYIHFLSSKTLAVVEGRKISYWDVHTGYEETASRGSLPVLPSINGFPLAFTSDGTQTAVVDHRKVEVMSTGFVICTLQGHIGSISAVAFSPNGELVVTGSEDNTAKIWNVDDVAGSVFLTQYRDRVRTELKYFFLTNNTIIEKCGNLFRTPQYKRWDADTHRQLPLSPIFAASPDDVVCSPKGKWIVTLARDTFNHTFRVTVWNAVTEHTLFSTPLRLVSRLSHCLAFSPDESKLVIASDGHFDYDTPSKTLKADNRLNAITLWDLKSGRLLSSLGNNVGLLNSVSFSPDCRRIIVGNLDSVQVWNAITYEKIRTIKITKWVLVSATPLPDSKQILATLYNPINKDKSVLDKPVIYEIKTGAQLPFTSKTIWRDVFDNFHKIVSFENTLCLAYAPDHKRIVVSTNSSPNIAQILDVATGRVLVILKGHTSEVTTAVFSPDGKRVLTGSSDGTARL